MRKLNLIGERFDKLIVLGEIGSSKIGILWLCECECGKKIVAPSGSLRSGHTKSCGCSYFKHGMSGTRLYTIWKGIIKRCTSVTAAEYKYYGGRGITVCNEWLDFRQFYKDMIAGYESHLTIDRIDNDKGYSKDNCRWSTFAEQSLNRSNNVRYTYNGETLTLSQWAQKHNVLVQTIQGRLKRGWDFSRAISTPVKKYRPYIKRSMEASG